MVDTLEDDPAWYCNAIFYSLPVRAFFDANNDGIGDFPGLTRKLDYLTELGVTAVWLLPWAGRLFYLLIGQKRNRLL